MPYVCLLYIVEDRVLHRQLTRDLLFDVSQDLVTEFVRVFLLQTNQSAVRTQMHSLLLALYEKSEAADQKEILKLLWPLWSHISQYGRKGGYPIPVINRWVSSHSQPLLII